jgi:hypothetical protein
MVHKIISFFDKLEDKIRGHLSQYPLIYALIGGVGIILFWRGVWHAADEIPYLTNSWISIFIGILILLLTGVFVSAFIGNRLLITGLKGEKKLAEKTKNEIDDEDALLTNLQNSLDKIEGEIEDIKKEISDK